MRSSAVFFILFLLISRPAMAGEPLFFRDKIEGVREQSLLDFLTGQKLFDPALPYRIAAKDLNGDGTDEWIIRQSASRACEANADCGFYVLGLSDQYPVVLGSFTARKVGISDEKAYGVRSLFVYNVKNNDFTFQSYVWNPLQGGYRPE